ncbi:MAG: nucleoside hydrolase [Phycisphaerae bacterium]|nr:nucleoside hydrolase [Phycisphaerae bacterium]
MATPVLIDTDMGVDDAVAVALALRSDAIDLVGVASVEGNVPLAQATVNVARLLTALRLHKWPPIARGLAQVAPGLEYSAHVHGPDGMGNLDLATPEAFAPCGYVELYRQLIGQYGKSLAILAIGPLTNLAALVREKPDLLVGAGQIIIMGGAVWCPGNVTQDAEFNFYRDPAAAATVLSAGLPVTVVPLDVTRQVQMDESHVARLSRSRSSTAELLARMIRFPMEQCVDGGRGTFFVHDALALGVLIWPSLFMRARMGLDVTTDGKQAGRVRPTVGKDKSRQVGVVISVNVVDFLENLLEQLCQERFVV